MLRSFFQLLSRANQLIRSKSSNGKSGIKSITARQLFREFPDLKRKLWSGEIWEDGYFARTVGDRMTREVVEKYIKHHRNTTQGPAQIEIKLR